MNKYLIFSLSLVITLSLITVWFVYFKTRKDEYTLYYYSILVLFGLSTFFSILGLINIVYPFIKGIEMDDPTILQEKTDKLNLEHIKRELDTIHSNISLLPDIKNIERESKEEDEIRGDEDRDEIRGDEDRDEDRDEEDDEIGGDEEDDEIGGDEEDDEIGGDEEDDESEKEDMFEGFDFNGILKNMEKLK